MKDGLKIMDSDMHVREPADLWEKYMEPEWRDRGPRILSTTTRSSAMVMVDGKILKGYPPSLPGRHLRRHAHRCGDRRCPGSGL